MDREITLREYGRVAWSGRWLIAATIAVAVVVGLLLSLTQTTTYRATARVFLGQATSANGVPVPTPYTTPVIAAQILKGDDLVDATVAAIGVPAVDADRVRDAVDFTIARTAGAASVNQPTLATVVVTDRERPVARQIANAYAEAVEAKALRFYEPQAKIRQDRIDDLVQRETSLQTDLDAYRRSLARGGADVAAVGILLESYRAELTEVRRDISEQRLETKKAEQIERPDLVNRAGTPASSGGARNVLQRLIFAGILGLILGLVATFAWKGSPAGRAGEAPH